MVQGQIHTPFNSSHQPKQCSELKVPSEFQKGDKFQKAKCVPKTHPPPPRKRNPRDLQRNWTAVAGNYGADQMMGGGCLSFLSMKRLLSIVINKICSVHCQTEKKCPQEATSKTKKNVQGEKKPTLCPPDIPSGPPLKQLAKHLHKPKSKTIVIDLGKRALKPAYFESSLLIIHEC